MRLFCSLFLILIVFTSCEIENQFHFNEDFSGHATTTFDLKNLKVISDMNQGDQKFSSIDSLLQFFESPEMDLNSKRKYDSIFKTYEEFGLLDFKISRNGETKLDNSYRFNDISIFGKESKLQTKFTESASDEIGSNLDNGSGFNLFFFQMEKENNWLEIDLAGKSIAKEELEGYKEEIKQMRSTIQDPQYDNLSDEEFGREILKSTLSVGMDFYKLKNTFSFAREIKEIQSSLPYEQEGNTIYLNYSIGDLMIELMLQGEVKLKVRLE